MKFSLDTHIVLWWFHEPENISKTVLGLLTDSENEVFVSSAVLWEISIKASIGKLKITDGFFRQLQKDFVELPIRWKHTLEVAKLENLHQDPFDRLLIAQAKVENLTFITADKNVLRYPFQVMKA